MKCPHCGKSIDVGGDIEPPEKVFIIVRAKRIGFSRPMKGQHRLFAALSEVFENAEDAAEMFRLVEDDLIYECKKLGRSGEIRKRMGHRSRCRAESPDVRWYPDRWHYRKSDGD